MSQVQSKAPPKSAGAASRGRAQPRAVPLLVVHDAALLLAIFYAPIYWGTFSTGGQALAALLVGTAACAALVWRLLANRPVSVIPNAIHLPALVLIVISALSTLVSTSSHSSALEFTRLLTGFLLFVLIANRALMPAAPAKPVALLVCASWIAAPLAKTSGELGWTLDLLTALGLAVTAVFLVRTEKKPDPVRHYLEALVLCAGFTIAIYGLREKAITYYFMTPRNPSWAIFSTFFNKNMIGGFLALLVPLAVSVTLAAEKLWQRLVWGLAALLTAVTLLPTYSKGSELSVLAALAVLGLLLAAMSRRPRRNAILAVGVYAVLALAVVGAFHAAPHVKSKVMEAFSDRTSSNMFRILTWKATFNMALHHPVLGIGPGAFKSVFPAYAIAGYTEAAHENYLHIASEQGFPGLLAFLWLLGATLYTGWRVVRDQKAERARRLLAAGGLAAVVALMGHSLLDFDWYIGAIMLSFWAIAGLLAHLGHGREPVAEVVEEAPEPGKGKRRRLGATLVAMLPAETDTHRLPWPKAPTGRTAAVLVVAALLGYSFWTAERNALAQRAREAGESIVAQRDEALGARDQALAQGDQAAAQQDLTIALQEQDEASALFRAAVDWDPSWSGAHERLGVVLPFDQGLAEVRRAIELNPHSYQPYLSLARMEDGAKQYPEAIAAYQQSLQRFPGNTRARRYLAEAYRAAGKPADALRTYEQLALMQNSLAARYPAIAQDVDTNYAYADYEVAKAEAADFPADHNLDHLRRALFRIVQAEDLVARFFQPNSGEALDAMFQSIGKPRRQRSQELLPLLLQIYDLKAQVFHLWGRKQDEAAARAQLQQVPALYASDLAASSGAASSP